MAESSVAPNTVRITNLRPRSLNQPISIYEIVRRIDEGAYIIQSEARSVYGNGFDPLRMKPRKTIRPKQ